MRFLKGLALSLFGFLLFISLIILGPGYMLNSTVLNAGFIGGEIDKIPVASIVSDVFSEESSEDSDFPAELETALLTTIREVEPVAKEQLKAAIRSIGDYLRGNKDDPELSLVMSETFFNASFVEDVLDKVDLADIAESAITEDLPPEFADAVTSTIAKHEAGLKTRVAAASGPIFSYVLGNSSSVDLAEILRDDVLDSEFITILLDEVDSSFLSAESLGDLIGESIPEDTAIPIETLDDAIAALEPAIKEAMQTAADPIVDYLLGQGPGFTMVISLEPAMDDLESALRKAYLDFPPAGWDMMSQSERDRLLNEFLDLALSVVPSSFEIDESMFGDEIPRQIRSALADAEGTLAELRGDIAEGISTAEDALAEARQYISYFLNGYMILLAVIGVSVLAIIGLHLRVKGAGLHLGITAVVCGAIQFAAVLVGKNYATSELAELEVPQAVQGLPELLINDFTAPLQTLSLGLLIGGVVLIVFAVLYPRLRGGSSEAAE